MNRFSCSGCAYSTNIKCNFVKHQNHCINTTTQMIQKYMEFHIFLKSNNLELKAKVFKNQRKVNKEFLQKYPPYFEHLNNKQQFGVKLKAVLKQLLLRNMKIKYKRYKDKQDKV